MTDKKLCENCDAVKCKGDAKLSSKNEYCAQWQRNQRKWLSIMPEEPGWYWLKEKVAPMQIVEVIMVHRHVYRSGTECFSTLNEIHGEWQGPIRPEGE